MRKALLAVLLLIGCSLTMSAELFNQSQKKLKTEIFNELKKYGTNIKDDGDEYMWFKADDILYQVYVSSKDYDPMYVSMGAVFDLPESYDLNISQQSAIKAIIGYPVFCAIDDHKIAFMCKMYVKDAKAFTTVLPNMINAIRESIAKFDDVYNEIQNSAVVPSDSDNNVIVKATKVNSSHREFIYPPVTGKKSLGIL